MKYALIWLFTSGFFISASVFAGAPLHYGDEGLVRAESISNCRSWTYSSTVSAYVCQSFPFSTSVAEAYSTQDAIRSLEKRVSDLESRIQLSLQDE